MGDIKMKTTIAAAGLGVLMATATNAQEVAPADDCYLEALLTPIFEAQANTDTQIKLSLSDTDVDAIIEKCEAETGDTVGFGVKGLTHLQIGNVSLEIGSPE